MHILRIFAACLLLTAAPVALGQPRSWSIRDSVETSYLSSEDGDFPAWASDEAGENQAIKWSPSRQHLFFVVRRGDLQRSCNVYEILVFSSTSLTAALLNRARTPDPVVRYEVCSRSSYLPGIGGAHWLTDQQIAFLGTHGSGQNVYVADVSSRTVSRITNLNGQETPYSFGPLISSYAISSLGSLIYTTVPIETTRRTYENFPVAEVIGISLVSRGERVLYHQRPSTSPSVLDASFGMGQILSISPDGRWAVTISPQRTDFPETWRIYPLAGSSMRHFVLWDLERGVAAPMLDAPTGQSTVSMMSPTDLTNPWPERTLPEALWSHDSRRVILVNTALPQTRRLRPDENTSFVIDYDVTTRQWRQLLPVANMETGERISAANVLRPGRLIEIPLLSIDRNPATTDVPRRVGSVIFRYRPSRGWSPDHQPGGVPVVAENGSDLRVMVEQSANQPPVVSASLGGRKIELWSRSYDGVRRAEVTQFEWNEPSNTRARGLLMLPERAVGSPLPPLVINIYQVNPELFRPDGPNPTGYAAQPLVTEGFAVLNIAIPDNFGGNYVRGSIREPQAMVARIDAAVNALGRQRLVDTSRVGLVGFSRGGYMTYYVVTHPGTTRIGAAVVADGHPGGPSAQFREYAAIGRRQRSELDELEVLYGGSIASSPESWIEHAPELNVHQSRTPTLFAYNGLNRLFAAQDTLGAFRSGRRPVEFLLFPRGRHQLLHPEERLASLSATVDWMRFWLQNRENEDSRLAARYTRWREMREDWRQVQTEQSATAVTN